MFSSYHLDCPLSPRKEKKSHESSLIFHFILVDCNAKSLESKWKCLVMFPSTQIAHLNRFH